MIEKENQPKYEIDLFDFIDILIKRKFIIISFFGVAIIFAVIYCFILRGEIPTIFDLLIGVRYPDQSEVVSYEPDNPKQKINIGLKLKSLIEGGILNGKLQDALSVETIPRIKVEMPKYSLPVLRLTLRHHNENDGKKILKTVVDLIQHDQIIQDILKKERKLLSAEINKLSIENNIIQQKIDQLKEAINNNKRLVGISKEQLDRLIEERNTDKNFTELIHLFEKQLLQMNMNREVHYELMNRLIREINDNKNTVSILVQKRENINMAFKPVGTISSSMVFLKRISNRRIMVFSSIIGLVFGILLVFILEIRTKHLGVS